MILMMIFFANFDDYFHEDFHIYFDDDFHDCFYNDFNDDCDDHFYGVIQIAINDISMINLMMISIK